MKNKINEANKYECVLCETGEGKTHGLECSENKPTQKILNIDFKIEAKREMEFLEAIEKLNEEGLTLKSEVVLNEDLEI